MLPGSSAGWEERDGAVVVTAPVDVIAFTPRSGRVDVGLVVPPRPRVIDLSAQPGAVTLKLAATAAALGERPAHLESAARAAAYEAAALADAPLPDREIDLLGVLGAIAFPILSAAYDLGAAPVARLPRWAVPVFERPTVGDAARVAFGPSATRTVRRALVDTLRPLADGTVDHSGLALALMAAPVVQPDRLARILSADRVRQDPATLPDPATLRATRPTLDRWGPVRVERILSEAAGLADGLVLALRTIAYAADLTDHGPSGPLPHRLHELHDVYRALVRSPPARTQPARIQPPRIQPATPRVAPEAATPPHRALAPPATRGRVRHDAPIRYKQEHRCLDGLTRGDLTLVLPHTTGDLERWGRILSNCLGDFSAAAATGRSVIVGVRRSNRLIYAVELTAGGEVRQFCGQANRAPRPSDRRLIVQTLAEAGAVDTSSAVNRLWAG